MEFFQEINNTNLTDSTLKDLIQISNLTTLCDSINTIIADNGNDGVIYCVWGEFNIRRDEIKHGVRISLLSCPHALTWTITRDNSNNKIIIHCTINNKDEDPEFINSIHEFVADWATGLTNAIS